MDYENAATRLHRILTKFRAHALQNGSELTTTVWRRVFGLPDTVSDIELYAHVAKVISLPHEALEELQKQSEVIQKAAGPSIIQLGYSFGFMQLQGQVGTFCQKIDDQALNALLLSAAIIGAENKIKFLQESDLENLRSKFRELENQVFNADIDKQLKVALLGYTRHILQAIDTYDLTGIKPIINGIEAAYGHIVVDEEYRNFLRDDQVGKSFIETLQSACAIVSAIADAPAAIGVIVTALVSIKSTLG